MIGHHRVNVLLIVAVIGMTPQVFQPRVIAPNANEGEEPR